MDFEVLGSTPSELRVTVRAYLSTDRTESHWHAADGPLLAATILRGTVLLSTCGWHVEVL